MLRYAMVLIRRLCTGCQTCVVACKMENRTLPGISRTVVTESADATWRIGMCAHCENPPCVDVCPVDATWKNNQGITVVDQSLCIGCGNCVEACPYDARQLNPNDDGPVSKELEKAGQGHKHHQLGKADKCDFCLHRLKVGNEPMCVESCTTLARVFGDLDDPQSEVSRLVSVGAKTLKPHLGTGPRVYYL